MMRRYFLINEMNKGIELRNVRDGMLASDLAGLGYTHQMEYVRVGNSYRLDNKELSQGILSTELTFLSYDKFQEFMNYIENSKSLRIIYKPTDTEYYTDVDFEGITDITKNVNMVQCNVTFNRKSLYYTQDDRRFTLEAIEGESRWPLPFPFTFNDYSDISITYNNRGHTDSEFIVEIYGYTEKPELKLFIDGVLKYKVSFNVTIQEGQKLLYSAKDGNNYVAIQRADGSQEYIPNCLSLESDNFFKIPKGQSVLKVSTDSGVRNKVVFSILTAYKGV